MSNDVPKQVTVLYPSNFKQRSDRTVHRPMQLCIVRFVSIRIKLYVCASTRTSPRVKQIPTKERGCSKHKQRGNISTVANSKAGLCACVVIFICLQLSLWTRCVKSPLLLIHGAPSDTQCDQTSCEQRPHVILSILLQW
jgi:hypothetical protein